MTSLLKTEFPLDTSNKRMTAQVEGLLEQMTLLEKIGQMTQVDKNSIKRGDIKEFCIGSILSGGGGNPEPNTPENWRAMVSGFQEEALAHRLGIPLLYGVDAVHGHNNLKGATIFPHNIGLGAARDSDLLRRIGRITALEVSATGARWNFAPAVSVPQDIRWGRTYEGYSQDTDLVTELAVAYVGGLQGNDLSDPTAVLPSIKHYLADGATTWGSSKRIDRSALSELSEADRTLAIANVGEDFLRFVDVGAWRLDQGESDIDEVTLRRVHLPPYKAALEAGALNVMVSFSSWGGRKMHAHRYLLTEVLKGELGFKGFVVSDWEAIDQIAKDYYTCVVESINAGIDMVMVPFDHIKFIETLHLAVKQGDVPKERINDAVRRILYVKVHLGLFERPFPDEVLLERIGLREHRNVAREAVRRSLVLLKNEGVLPLTKSGGDVLVAGIAADDIGFQCGGWTISWMGSPGPITPGTTILEGIRKVAKRTVHYVADGAFEGRAEVGLVVLAEEPYAEGMGDREDLHLTPEQKALLGRVRAHCDKLIVILLSGRPLIVTDELPGWDAFVAAWLPGTEGDGVADVLFGDYPFTGRLSFVWPRSMAQVPLSALGDAESLFPLGYGLNTGAEGPA